MAKNIVIYDLLERYGALLTEKQQKMLEFYYFDDLSLSEIAENEGFSRQAAQDLIKRAENELLEIEKKLGLKAKEKEKNSIIAELKKAVESEELDKAKELIYVLENI